MSQIYLVEFEHDYEVEVITDLRSPKSTLWNLNRGIGGSSGVVPLWSQIYLVEFEHTPSYSSNPPYYVSQIYLVEFEPTRTGWRTAYEERYQIYLVEFERGRT